MSIDLTNRPLSYSSLKEFAKSPRHYIEYINKPKFAPTDAMKLGSMVHCLLLQSHDFDNQFLIAPEINKRTNAGKEEWSNLLLNNPNKQIVSNEDYTTASNLVRSAFANPNIEKAVKDCHSFEEVERQLVKAIHCSLSKARQIAWNVHNKGSEVVYVGHLERCEAVAMVLEDIGLLVKIES